MIQADFYQTERTVCAGAVSLTDNITNIEVGGSIADIATPYYIGYVNYDDMPKICVPMFPKFDRMGDDKILSFYQTPENHSWGFLYTFYSGTTSMRAKNMYYRASLTDTNYTAEYTSTDSLHRFLNKIQMCNYAGSNLFQLGFHAFVVPIADIEDGTTQFKEAQSDGTYTLKTFTATYDSNLGTNYITLNILQRLINNEIPVMSGSTTIGGESLPFGDIYYSDFNEFGLASKDTNNGLYRVFLWIDRIWVYGWGFYAGTQRYACGIEPFFEFTLPESENNYPEQTALYTPGQWQDYDFRISMTNNELYLLDVGLFTGNVMTSNIPYSISKKDLLDAGIFLNKNGVVKNSYVLIEAGGSDSDYKHYFYPHFDLNDIYKYLMFFHKIDIQGTNYNNTTPSDTYTTRYSTALFNGTDTPLYERVSEDYQTIEDKLRPWQMPNTDITVNDYDPIDKPPYVPPGPEPSDDENIGTDIRRPTGLGVGGTNGFITQYALTASQIAEIGRLLWLNFTDADYYKNFLFALTTTGSIDISNLMDYFVSLRVYPFPLINVPSWAAAGQDMYIGAGVIPLHFSSTIHTINNYADYIEVGSCAVPRYFNDFRDFTHTQILLFLPYCGTVQLNPADVIGGTLYAQYAIDFASGGVNAYVDLQTHDGKYFMIASLSGNIGADIPLTATNAAQIASKIAGDALNFAGTIGGAAAGDLGNRIGGAVSALTGNAIGVAGAAAGLVTQPIQGAASIAQEGMRIATSDGVKIPMLSGGRGFGSFGQPQTAYIQIRRGMYVEGQTAPQGFKHAFGEAYDQPVQVGSCSGYTVFDNIDTSGLSCTDAERAAIVKQMQQGIFI